MGDEYRCPRCGQIGVPSTEMDTCAGCANHLLHGDPDPKSIAAMMASTKVEPREHRCPKCGWTDRWQTHAVRETITVYNVKGETFTDRYAADATALYRVCGRCGHAERRTYSTDWEPWVAANKEGDG